MNRNTLIGLRDGLQAFWQERDLRERKILVFAGAFLVLALIYLLLIDPPLSGRARLEKSLPALRLQSAELQGLAAQAAQLAQQGAPAIAPVSKESLDAALARHALKSQSLVMTGELTKIQFADASFAAIVSLLDELQRSARLSVQEANVEALPTLDRVNATLTLRQQTSEQGS